VVGLPIVLQAGVAVALVVRTPGWLGRANLGLLVLALSVTGLVSVPLHDELTGGFDAGAIDALVQSNRVRVAAWTGQLGVAALFFRVVHTGKWEMGYSRRRRVPMHSDPSPVRAAQRRIPMRRLLLLLVLATLAGLGSSAVLLPTPPALAQAIGDSDGDGYADNVDFCPSEPGGAREDGANPNADGCPKRDADGDGFGDGQENCPSEAGGPGSAGINPNAPGCPKRDADGDGYGDTQDGCPSQPGPAGDTTRQQGCPIPPDTDGDTVPDPRDSCPTTAGSPLNGGCPPPPPPMATGPVDEGEKVPSSGQPGSPDDADGDGVRNADDLCARTFQSELPTDPQGCGPFRATAFFGARSTQELGDEPNVGGQCENARGKQCRFHVTITLSRASAARLGLKARIVDLTWTTNKSTFAGKYVYKSNEAAFSRKEERAFAKAERERIPVTMTFTGTVARGTAAPVKLGTSTFTMKRRPQGGTAYRIEPSVGVGPDGRTAQGLTRKPTPGDFRLASTR
jgi:hypothetical protein